MAKPKVMLAMSSKSGPSIRCFNSIPFKEFETCKADNSTFLDASRNHLVDFFLKETDCDYLLWVDDDAILPPNIMSLFDLDDLVKAPLCWQYRELPGPGVGMVEYGVYRESEEIGNDTMVNYHLEVERDKIINKNEKKRIIISDIDAMGGGVLAIHRDVFEATRDEQGEWFRTNWIDEKGKIRRAEDFYFYRLLRDAGYKIAIDTTIECGHSKTIDMKAVGNLTYKNVRYMLRKDYDEKHTERL